MPQLNGTLTQRIISGPGNDSIFLHNTSVSLDAGNDTDTLTIVGTSNADHIEVNASGIRLGGDKFLSLSMASVEIVDINTGNGDDFVHYASNPTANPIRGINFGEGRDKFKFGATQTPTNTEHIIRPSNIVGVELLDMSGLGIDWIPHYEFQFLAEQERGRIEELDLRYNGIKLNRVDEEYWVLGSIPSLLPNLKHLYLHGNPGSENANLNGLKGKWFSVDLAPVDLPRAEALMNEADALAAVAKSLLFNPLKIFEYVRNNIEFEPYYGRKKSPLAVIQTKKANDFDMANLLIELYKVSGVNANDLKFAQVNTKSSYYVSLPHSFARSWLNTDPAPSPNQEASRFALRGAYFAPTAFVVGAHSTSDRLLFDHTWAEVNVGGVWRRMTPSIKLHASSQSRTDLLDQLNRRVGKHYLTIGELLADQVPINPGEPHKLDYLDPNNADPHAYFTPENGQNRNYGLVEWYEQRVSHWLAMNAPGVSLADLRTDLPILAERISSIEDAWPDELIVGAFNTTTNAFVELYTSDLNEHGQSGQFNVPVLQFNEPAEKDYWTITIDAKDKNGVSFLTPYVNLTPLTLRVAEFADKDLYVSTLDLGGTPALYIDGVWSEEYGIRRGGPNFSANANKESFSVEVGVAPPIRYSLGNLDSELAQVRKVSRSERHSIDEQRIGHSKVVAIGLDAGQVSTNRLFAQQAIVNEEQAIDLMFAYGNSLNPQSPITPYNFRKIGRFLSMTNSLHRFRTAEAAATLDALFGSRTVSEVHAGFFTADDEVFFGNIHAGKPYPITLSNLSIDLVHQEYARSSRAPLLHSEFDSKSYSHSPAFTASSTLLAAEFSANEHLVLEELTDIEAYSTIKIFQETRRANNEILVFTNNAAWDSYNSNTNNPNRLSVASDKPTKTIYDQIELEFNTFSDQIVLVPRTPIAPVTATQTVYDSNGAKDPASSAWIGNGFFSSRITGTSGSRNVKFMIANRSGYAHGGYNTNRFNPTLTSRSSNVDPSTQKNVIGDPVNPVTGSFYDEIVDINIPAIGLPLVFSRYYDSLTAEKTGKEAGLRVLGDGWWHNYSDRLSPKYPLDVTSPSTTGWNGPIDWTTSQGSVYTFEKNSAGYTVPASLKGEFWSDPNSNDLKYSYRDRSGLKRIFDNYGLLREIVDQFDNRLVLEYHANGALDALRGRLLKTVTSQPNGQGFTPDSQTSLPSDLASRPPTFNALEFGYPEPPNTPGNEIKRLGYVRPMVIHNGNTYYGESVNFTVEPTIPAVTPPRYKLTQVASSNSVNDNGNVISLPSRRTEYSYIDSDTVSSKRYNKLGSIRKLGSDSSSGLTLIDYYANGRVFRVTDPEGNQQHFTYNLHKRQTTFVDERRNSTRFYFDIKGNDVGTRYPDGARTQKKWNEGEQRLEWESDEGNLRRSYVYNDAYDNVSRIDTQTYVKNFSNGTGSYQNLYSEHFAYTNLRDSNNKFLSSRLDQSTTRTDSGALTTNWYRYPSNNSPLLEKTIHGVTTNESASFLSAERVSHTWRYPNGLVGGETIQVWDPSVNVNSHVHDDFAHVLSREFYAYADSGQLTAKQSMVAPGQGIFERFRYDQYGRLVKTIDGRNIETQNLVRDTLGQVYSVTVPFSPHVSALGSNSSYTFYDGRGNVVSQKDRIGRNTSNAYDRNQRSIGTTLPDGSLTQTVYDAMGNVVYQTDELGRTIQNIYDSRNRVIQTILPDGVTTTYSYDGRGNRTNTVEYLKSDGYLPGRETGSATAQVDVAQPWTKIQVKNPSFEYMNISNSFPDSIANFLPDGQFSQALNVYDLGWEISPPTNPIENRHAQLFNPTASDFTPATTDGEMAIIAYGNESISQELDITLEPNTTYFLFVDVGVRNLTSSIWDIELRAGTTVLSRGDNFSFGTTSGKYTRIPLIYRTEATGFPEGKLSIRLRDFIESTLDFNSQTVFDNVQFYKRPNNPTRFAPEILKRESKSFFNVLGLPSQSIAPTRDGEASNPWTPVAIKNPSFELVGVSSATPGSSTLNDGEYVLPHYETDQDEYGWNFGDSPLHTNHVFNPAAYDFFHRQTTDGNIAAVGRGENGISQVLNEELEPNTTYLLLVDVGNRITQPFQFSIQLFAGNTQLAVANSVDFPTAGGAYRTASLTYSTYGDIAQFGNVGTTVPSGKLKIQLTGHTGDAAFDNVRVFKRSTIDLKASATHMQYSSSGQHTSTVDPRIHLSAWQNAANPFDVNNNGVANYEDHTYLKQLISNRNYSVSQLLPTVNTVFVFPDVNGDGLLSSIDLDALGAKFSAAPENPYFDSVVPAVNGTSFKYDALGRVIEKTEPNGLGFVWGPDVAGKNIVKATPTHGDNVAYAINQGQIAHVHTTFDPSKTYELEVDIGQRSDLPFGDFQVKLIVNFQGANYPVAMGDNSWVYVPKGGFGTLRLISNAPQSLISAIQNAPAGTAAPTIQIVLRKFDTLVNSHVLFDNVRLKSKLTGSTAPFSNETLRNPSFDDQTISDGGISAPSAPIAWWQHSSNDNFYVLNPSTSPLTVPSFIAGSLRLDPDVSKVSAANGSYIVLAGGDGSSGPSEMYQDLTTKWQANQRYTLEVDVGARHESSFGQFAVELWAGTQLLASKNHTTFTAVRGQFATLRLEFDSPSNIDTSEDIRIKITAVRVGFPVTHVAIDNVRLTSQAFSTFPNIAPVISIPIQDPNFEELPNWAHHNLPTNPWHPNGFYLNGNDIVSVGAIRKYEHDYIPPVTSPTTPIDEASFPQIYTGITREIDSRGTSTWTRVDGRGRTISTIVKDPSGNIVTKSTSKYDESDNLIQSVGPRGYMPGNNPLGYTTSYGYDDRSQLVHTTMPTTTGVDHSDANPSYQERKIEHAYDQVGNVVLTRVGSLSHLTNTAETTFIYDKRNRKIEETSLIRRATEQLQPSGSSSKIRLDRVGNVIQTIDPMTRSSFFQYDVMNRPIVAWNAIGDSTSTTYTSSGNVHIQTDPKGNQTKTYYDLQDRPTLVIAPDPDGVGVNKEEKSLAVQTRYDASGQVTESSKASFTGNLTSPLSVTDLRTTSYQYDRLGRLILQTDPDPDGDQIAQTSPLHFFRYDVIGNKIAEYNPRGAKLVPHTYVAASYESLHDYDAQSKLAIDERFRTDYRLDALNRVVERTTPDADLNPNLLANVPNYNGPLDRPVWSYTYDWAGNVLTETDPLGRKSAYTYDTVGLKRTFSQYDVNAANPSATTKYDYDVRGNLVKTTDPVFIETRYEYDLLNRQTAIDGQDVNVDGVIQTRRSTTNYDAAGNVTSTTDAAGRTTKYTFDPSTGTFSPNFPPPPINYAGLPRRTMPTATLFARPTPMGNPWSTSTTTPTEKRTRSNRRPATKATL